MVNTKFEEDSVNLRVVRRAKTRIFRAEGLVICTALALTGCVKPQEAEASTHSQVEAKVVFRDCETCPEMVAISPEIIGKAISFSIHELTWAQYAKAVDAASCPLPQTLADEEPTLLTADVRDDYPMTSLPPIQIDCYLDWLSAVSGSRYRLPSEAEWQAVAKAAGSEIIAQNSPGLELGVSLDKRTTVQRRVIRRVGQQYHPKVGLYDLFGNASEVVSSERKSQGWTIVKGGSSFERDDFDSIEEWRRVPENSSSATVGFRIVKEGPVNESN